MLSLSQVKQHLQTHKMASLGELSALLQEDDQTVQYLLQHFINKGQVCCRTLTPNCGSKCAKCPLGKTLIYEWQFSTLS